MLAQILAIKGGAPTIPTAHLPVFPDKGSLRIEVPSELAKRVTDAALWASKSPEQFILDMLRAAFLDDKGAA